MGLLVRMTAAITSLTIVTLCAFLAIGLLLGLSTYLVVGLSLFFVVLMWWSGPWIIRKIYKIKWVGIETLEPEIRDYITRVCKKNKIKIPHYGIIEDNNPNAFCFGRTRNNAYLVLTKGIDTYCSKEEKITVVAHEMGHIVHNDFIVMTAISAMPIIFYILYRSCFEAAKQPGGDKGKGYIAMVGIIAWVAYVITQFIVLMISRYREYWADRFSAQTTGHPNQLSSALVKIAYGLASEGKGNLKKDQIRYENSLMISDPRSGRSLAFNVEALKVKDSFSTEDIKEAMAWDLWNPWAKWLELNSSHPLPAKRIMVLDKVAEDMGQKPMVGFDLMQPESLWDEFLGDIIASYFWIIGILVGIFVLWEIDILSGFGVILSVPCLIIAFYLIFYRYPMGFRDATVEYCIDDPKANPKRGIPVRLEGYIIGRGNPGLFFNEDLKLDDGSGILLLEWHQVTKIIDLIEGIFRTERKIGKKAVVTGWYRRMITPYLEIYSIEWNNHKQKMRTRPVYIGLAVVFGFLGLFMQLQSTFTLLLTFAILGGYLLFMFMMSAKYSRWEKHRREAGDHPYYHLSSLYDAVTFYNVIQFCDSLPVAEPTNKFERYINIGCPKCGTNQDVKVTGGITSHVCKNCGVSGIIRLTY